MSNLDDHIVNLVHEFYDGLDDDLDFVEQEILNLLDTQDTNIRAVYAKVHSIKGSSGALGLDFISTVCHIFEDHLSHMDGPVSQEQGELFFNLIDLLRDYKEASFSSDLDQSAFSARLNALTSQNTKLKFLIVQNTKSFLRRYKQILEGSGIELSTAKNGYDALGRVLKEPFDLLLCDSQLDLISGGDLTKILKTVRVNNPNMKVAIVSSDENMTQESAGNPDFLLHKNIDYFSNIRKLFNGLLHSTDRTLSNGHKHLHNGVTSSNLQVKNLKSILCIDDDKLIQSLCKASTKSLDLENFYQSMEGLGGIQTIVQKQPDLVLLDYMLPDFDGLEILKDIRSRKIDVPIIFMTGKTSESDREELHQLDIAGIIDKPFVPQRLASQIKTIWEQYWVQKDEHKESA